MTDTDMLYMSSQAKRITDLENENRELKKLLKIAMSDIYKKCSCDNSDCDICEKEACEVACDYDDRFIWKHEEEALKLIGGNGNG